MLDAAPATRGRVLAAFCAVYFIWGSTYLAIRFALETLPPFLMAGVRFILAGVAIYAWRRWRGAPRPEAVHWRAAALIGTLLMLGGNGSVVWAEQRVPSGIAALLISAVPLWMVLFDWLRPGGSRPGAVVLLGLALGLSGIGLLVGPEKILRGARAGVDPAGAGVLLLGSLCWAAGSVYAQSAPTPKAPLLATGMQMMTGGVAVLLVAAALGEFASFRPAQASTRSIVAVVYLLFIGSIVTYSAYTFLLRTVTAAKVATYAFVNPVVAVLLGWAIAGEELTPRTAVAALVIVTAVAAITAARPRRARPKPQS